MGQHSYFITFCCEGRKRIFTLRKQAEWLIDLIRDISRSKGFVVHAYCVMPDHLHLLAVGLTPESSLPAFVTALKQKTAYEHKRLFGSVLWQRGYYDHILRSGEAIDSVAGYIWMNPVRKGLCKNPGDYPYSGSFSIVLHWNAPANSAEEWTPPWKQANAQKQSSPLQG